MVSSDIMISVNEGHSKKPDTYYQIAEELLNGTTVEEYPKLEIFSRKLYDHYRWVAIGNQIETRIS